MNLEELENGIQSICIDKDISEIDDSPNKVVFSTVTFHLELSELNRIKEKFGFKDISLETSDHLENVIYYILYK